MNTFSQVKEYWCPICPQCNYPIPTNHSKCKCEHNHSNLFCSSDCPKWSESMRSITR